LQEIDMQAVRPFRCFDARAIAASLAVAGWLVVSAWLGHGHAPGSSVRVLLACGQAAAFTALIVVLARSIAHLDELERRIHYVALAIGAVVVVTAIAAWAFLEWAGLPRVDWSVWALPLFTLSWASVVVWMSRSYR
jgi:hypothetical protein